MFAFHLFSNLVLWAIKRTSLLLLFRLPLITNRCTGGEVRNFQIFIFLYTKENVPYVFLLIFKITKSKKPLVYSYWHLYCDILCDLVPFLQYKKHENTYGGVLLINRSECFTELWVKVFKSALSQHSWVSQWAQNRQ